MESKKRFFYHKKNIVSLLIIAVLAYVVVVGCANMGQGPQGGPVDITPPKPLRSTPEQMALGFQKNRIEIVFDEIIQVDNAFENVIVSPPQKEAPIVKAVGRKLLIELRDTLLDSTTYTIDFGSAIVDNNEKIPLHNYSFSFSTGSQIDTLKLSGIVIDAETLNPVSGLMIGIHSDLSDSAFINKKFDRITRTDNQGKFTISNVKEGKYRIYGLDDIGNNFRFDMPNEQIAFTDSVFVPKVAMKESLDTTFRDSIVEQGGSKDTIRLIDTIIAKREYIYTPDSIILKSFTEEFYKQYLTKTERKDAQHFTIYFADKNDSLPKLEPINFSLDQLFVQANERKDTISYWLRDSVLWETDTLTLRLTYQKSDSLNQLQPQTDTLNFVYKKPKQSSSTRRQSIRQDFISITSNATSTFDFFKEVELSFKTPTFIALDTARRYTFEEKIDTNWRAYPCVLQQKDSLGLRYTLKTELKANATYRFKVDSAYFHDLYGKVNNTFTTNITTKPRDSYSTLTLELGMATGQEVVELLSKEDKVLRRIKVEKAGSQKIKFDLLDAGVYYARLFVDRNGNGKWDVGDYSERRQPEEVYYYPYYFELRQMWDSEEYWDYLEFPLLEQKPKELIKVKTNKK